MTECIKVSLDADRGMTLKSPNFFEVEEVLPPGSDIGTIEEGILAGTYTPIDLDLYSYEGKIKTDYSRPTLVDLDLVVSSVTIPNEGTIEGVDNYKVLTFKVPPTDTVKWENKETTLLFDIKRTEIADPTNVDAWVKGTIKVHPVITE